MKKIKEIETYFYNETADFTIKEIKFIEKRASYLDQIDCYLVTTDQNINFYIFSGTCVPMNLYSIKKDETLDECYYMHLGFMAELCSQSINNNFILDFIRDYSVFPILDRKLNEISKSINLNKNASQLNGVANQIRDCYLTLTDYLMNKVRTNNSNFKNDNFKDNLEEFLKTALPGSQSETRRNVINGIAQKGWKLNSELVHKDSVTIFDILISYNTLQLIISTISNLIVGDDMPFNKIKCPNCESERFTMLKAENQKEYQYMCKDCKTSFNVPVGDIVKRF